VLNAQSWRLIIALAVFRLTTNSNLVAFSTDLTGSYAGGLYGLALLGLVAAIVCALFLHIPSRTLRGLAAWIGRLPRPIEKVCRLAQCRVGCFIRQPRRWAVPQPTKEACFVVRDHNGEQFPYGCFEEELQTHH
jgi:hypothetical protein